jgi:TRAP-type C4-dicarboxylate transport system substrate-binding protein
MFRDFDHWNGVPRVSDLFQELADGYRRRQWQPQVISMTYYGARHTTSNKPHPDARRHGGA